MATITPVQTVTKDVVTVTWTGVSTADTMTPVGPFGGDKVLKGTAQITGTAGGGTFTLSASNDGVTYATLKDVGGAAISVVASASAMFDFSTCAMYFNPTASGGVADNVDFVLAFRRP